MGANHVLYDRPDLDQAVGALALYVDGSLPSGVPGSAYEGRLQIHNAIGNCSVRLISGTPPPGYNLAVDNATHEVVLTWPYYQANDVTVSNDFSAWNGWEPAYAFALDAGAARYDGQGEAGIYSPYMPVTPGTPTTLSIQAKCGSSGHEHVGFRSVIAWYDVDKNFMLIPGVQNHAAEVFTAGPIIFSPSQSLVASAVSATVPEGAAFARAYASCTRNRENKPMWVDNASWTLKAPAVGINANATICIRVRVKDSAGREADWYGCISVDGLGAQFSAWRYKQVARDDAGDYSAADFDDSDWATGPAPFGGSNEGLTGWPDAHSYDPRFSPEFATAWEVFTRLWLRRTLTLSSVPEGGYSFVGYIDDNFHLYVNGELVLSTPGDIEGGGYTDTIPASAFQVGENSIAVRCDDEAPGSTSITYADFLLDPVLE